MHTYIYVYIERDIIFLFLQVTKNGYSIKIPWYKACSKGADEYKEDIRIKESIGEF